MTHPTKVPVDHIDYDVYCSKERGSSVWVANGDYEGHQITGRGASRQKAIEDWRVAAYMVGG